MDTLLQDLRYALRTLRQNPGFTTVAVLTLALGIGANTAIFSVINGVLLRPLPYPEPDRLIALFMRGSELRSRALSYPDAQEIGGLTRDFSGVAPYTTQSYNFTGGFEPREVRAAQASDALFRVLGAEALLGRTFGPGELREQVAVLSHRLWANEFGSERGVIGPRGRPLSRRLRGVPPARGPRSARFGGLVRAGRVPRARSSRAAPRRQPVRGGGSRELAVGHRGVSACLRAGPVGASRVRRRGFRSPGPPVLHRVQHASSGVRGGWRH